MEEILATPIPLVLFLSAVLISLVSIFIARYFTVRSEEKAAQAALANRRLDYLNHVIELFSEFTGYYSEIVYAEGDQLHEVRTNTRARRNLLAQRLIISMDDDIEEERRFANVVHNMGICHSEPTIDPKKCNDAGLEAEQALRELVKKERAVAEAVIGGKK
ncbi:MAG: hypothetical protein AAGH90_09495 [Pseudomonadota bacterium]